jgi:hypothetical protein
MHRLRILTLASSGILLLAGCLSEQHCADVEQAAASVVLDRVYGDQPCQLDEDCEIVAINGSCFDSCSGVIATGNREAFEAALQQAEDEHCVDYGGCTLIHPPCDPPGEPICGDDGYCEEGGERSSASRTTRFRLRLSTLASTLATGP